MRSERIVATTLMLIVLILTMINYLSLDDIIANPAAIERLLKEEYRVPTSIADIEPVDSIVKPILYTSVDFIDQLATPQVKETFINIMIPAILIAKKEIDFQREQVTLLKEKSILSDLDSAFLSPLLDAYRANDINQLIKRMRTHPTSIVLGQAAIESGWGRSRFFKEANNVFGVWSMDPKDDRIPAQIQRSDRQVFLKKYPDVSASIKDYFLTVGKVNAYRGFRNVRAKTNDIQQLIPQLDKYSERGMDYVADLKQMIRTNQFERYDTYRLDPDYVK